jgi:hypothetical protein
VHVISRKMLLQAALKHGDLFAPLDAWYRIAEKAQWRSLEDVRMMFPTADSVGRFTVFTYRPSSSSECPCSQWSAPPGKMRMSGTLR